MLNHGRPLKVALVFTVSAAVWLAFFMSYGTKIAFGLLPVLRWEISHIAPQYRVIDMRVARQRGEAIFEADVATRHPLHIAGRAVPAGIPIKCSTLIGHLLQSLILLLSVITTASLVRRGNPAATLLLTCIAACFIIMIDVPFVLVGALEDMVLSVTTTSQTGFSLWVAWMDFLNGGGRLALALAAALTVVAASGTRARESGLTDTGVDEPGMETEYPPEAKSK